MPSDTSSVYYPSLVLNMLIRFDEGMTILTKSPLSIPELAELAGPATVESQEPLVYAMSGGDNLSKIIGIVPKSCSVEMPGYRQAGTFSFDLEFKDLPLDPRVIRAMKIAVHLGAVSASDFGVGITEVPDGKRKSIVTPTPDNLLIEGMVDSIDVEHSASGHVVHAEGRDLRGIFLDAKLTSETLAKIQMNQSIVAVVSQLVNKLHPQGSGIRVKYKPEDWPTGLPTMDLLGAHTRSNYNADGTQVVPTATGDANSMTFWDMVTQLCFLVGAIPFFKGPELWIRPSRSLYYYQQTEANPSPQNPTPFVNGMARNLTPPDFVKSEQITYRRLTFGKDIESLKFERKLGGTKVPVIECVSTDTSSTQRGIAKVIKVQVPDISNVKARTTSVGAGGDVPETDILRVPVPGIKDESTLRKIAENLREEIGRQEMGGSVQTKNLASLGGDNQDPDLVLLRPGDPIEFRVDASGLGVFPPPISELTDHAARSMEEEVKEVAKRIGDQNLARVLVASNRGEIVELQRTFRVNNVKYDWDVGSGVSIAFDFQNYVESRYAIPSS